MKKALLLLAAFTAASGAAQDRQSETTFQYGEWELAITVTSLDAPNIPESVRQNLRETIAGMGSRACMGGTVSDPARDLRDSFVGGFTSAIPDASCSFSERDTVANGVIRVQASCRSPSNGTETSVLMDGSYDENSVSANVAMAVGQIGRLDLEALMRMQARAIVRRIGPCTTGQL
jgi:hypothetical protein